MTPTQKISSMIVAKMKANGGDVAKAVDDVIGPGTFKALASATYHALRARAEAQERARQVAVAAIARARKA